MGNMFQTTFSHSTRSSSNGIIPNPIESSIIPGNSVSKMMRLAASDEIMSAQRADRFDPATEQLCDGQMFLLGRWERRPTLGRP